jgi:hypothetical protein
MPGYFDSKRSKRLDRRTGAGKLSESLPVYELAEAKYSRVKLLSAVFSGILGFLKSYSNTRRISIKSSEECNNNETCLFLVRDLGVRIV